MRLLGLLLCFIALSFGINNLSLKEIEFQNWMNEYGKSYADDSEYRTRFVNYLASVERVRERNAKSAQVGGATYGLTKFSDLDPEEFKRLYLINVPYVPETDREVLPQIRVAVPATFDWRNESKVTAVKNQAQCGSCWAFSATENIESVWMIAKGLTATNMKPLAPQQIVDCDKTDAGCNGGWPRNAFTYVTQAGGIEPEQLYPYHARNQNCAFKRADVYTTISSYKYATKTHNENEIKNNLVAWAPLSICVDAQTWQDYTGGVMTHTECGVSLDHCVLLTGYDGNSWNVRNSWGSNWGEKGYIRLEVGHNTCGMSDEATTAVV